ncbi:hypothetical protein PFISCL1PPCAC_25002, partial [Pristionchus fissidentatus]
IFSEIEINAEHYVTSACANFNTQGTSNFPPGVNITDLPDGNKKFECEKKEYSNVIENSIRIGAIMVYSALKCNPADGYTDIEGKKWADAEDRIEMDCDPSRCGYRDTRYCDETTKLPEGYRCASEYNPFKGKPVDPNLLSCGENEVFLIRNSIFDGKLRCHSDGAWYKIGDSSRNEAISSRGVPDVICVVKLCSECSELEWSASASSWFMN